MTNTVGLGPHLRSARMRAKKSLKSIADQLGWSSAKLSRIERDELTITVEDLAALAAALGRTPSSLLKQAEAN